MRLKDSTVTNLLTKAHELFNRLTSSEKNLQLSFSYGNRKIGRTPNVSTMPGLTCNNCKECINTCYAMRSALQYAICFEAWTKNAALLSKDRDSYFRQIDEKMCRRRTNKFFRWHVAGDIPDYDYFRRMVQIAVNHPDFTIWTYTKDYWFVNRFCRTHGGTHAGNGTPNATKTGRTVPAPFPPAR